MIVLLAQVVLAATFGVAGISKLTNPGAFADGLAAFGFSERWRPVMTVLPLGELLVALSLLPSASSKPAAAVALALLASFSAVIVRSLAAGKRPTCNCFGQLRPAPVGPAALGRNAALGILAAVVIWSPQVALGTADLVALVAATVVAAQAWLTYQLLRQNGRILARLTLLEGGAPPLPAALAPGMPAPELSLPSAAGPSVTLRTLLDGGRPLLLTFVNSSCGVCGDMLPRVARWQHRHVDALTIAVIAEGDSAAHVALAAEHGVQNVLLAADGDSARLFGVPGTPSAVLVGADGVVASELVLGTDAVGALVGDALPAAPDPHHASPAPTEPRGPTTAVATAGAATVLMSAPASAQSEDPERQAILSTLAAADPRLLKRAADLERAVKHFGANLRPTSAQRRAALSAVVAERQELHRVRTAVARATTTTPAARDAQQLAVDSLLMHDRSLDKVDAALRARFASTAAKRFGEARVLFDQALQRGVDAKAALRGQ